MYLPESRRPASADGRAADASVPDEKPSAYAIKTVWASALGYALEAFDNFILSFTLVAITAAFSLSSPQAGSLATLTLIGAVVGGFVFGILSDYFGRVRVLTWTIVIFAVFTAAIVLARNYAEIAALRFGTGLGIGGEYGIGMALVTESWPKSWRGRATTMVALGSEAGLVLALLVGTVVMATIGNWRIVYLIGLFPAVVAFWYRFRVPEPEAFLRAKGRRTRFPLRSLFTDARTTRASVGIIILTSVQNFGYYGIITFLPTYLSKGLGYSVTKTGAWTAATVLGFVVGMIIFGFLSDRIGRKPSFVIFMIGAILSLIGYSQLHNEIALLVGGGIMGIFVNGMLGGYGALTASLFPSEMLGTAQNVLYNIGRGVGAFSPIVIGFVADKFSFPVAIALLSLIYVIDILAVLLVVPKLGRHDEAALA
jgi:MFS family permease